MDNKENWFTFLDQVFDHYRLISIKRDSGFTLIELLVALVVLTIVVTAALPAFTSVIRDNRLATQANELLTAMMYARSEAGIRRSQVRVCAGGSSCNGDWETGWVVYDVDNDEVLRTWPSLDDGMSLTAWPDASFITYEGRGWVDARRSLVLCDVRGVTSRAINITPTGRAGMARREGGAGDGLVDDIHGNDVQL